MQGTLGLVVFVAQTLPKCTNQWMVLRLMKRENSEVVWGSIWTITLLTFLANKKSSVNLLKLW